MFVYLSSVVLEWTQQHASFHSSEHDTCCYFFSPTAYCLIEWLYGIHMLYSMESVNQHIIQFIMFPLCFLEAACYMKTTKAVSWLLYIYLFVPRGQHFHLIYVFYNPSDSIVFEKHGIIFVSGSAANFCTDLYLLPIFILYYASLLFMRYVAAIW